MKNSRDKASYCIGLEMGQQLKNQFQEMNQEILVKGVSDGFSGKQPELPIEEVRNILTAIRQQIEMQQKQFVAKLAEDNKKKGEEFLEQNKKHEGVVQLPSGLQYKVLNSGSGATPTLLDIVKVHYRGYFINGNEFENSYEQEKPPMFPVNRVIPGWSEALQKMKVGDKWRIFVPSYLAYGEGGFGQAIEPNMVLQFDMELLGIEG